jgi:hypothetical protein
VPPAAPVAPPPAFAPPAPAPPAPPLPAPPPWAKVMLVPAISIAAASRMLFRFERADGLGEMIPNIGILIYQRLPHRGRSNHVAQHLLFRLRIAVRFWSFRQDVRSNSVNRRGSIRSRCLPVCHKRFTRVQKRIFSNFAASLLTIGSKAASRSLPVRQKTFALSRIEDRWRYRVRWTRSVLAWSALG